MADLGREEGQLADAEVLILKNLLRIREITVREIMTPRTVLFTLSEDTTVGEFSYCYQREPFARIPVYEGERENITGYGLRSDLSLVQVRGNEDSLLGRYRRRLPAYIDSCSSDRVFRDLVKQRAHIMLIVDEYGNVEGIVTMEDMVETLRGLRLSTRGIAQPTCKKKPAGSCAEKLKPASNVTDAGRATELPRRHHQSPASLRVFSKVSYSSLSSIHSSSAASSFCRHSAWVFISCCSSSLRVPS